jgi:hypothetical protein
MTSLAAARSTSFSGVWRDNGVHTNRRGPPSPDSAPRRAISLGGAHGTGDGGMSSVDSDPCASGGRCGAAHQTTHTHTTDFDADMLLAGLPAAGTRDTRLLSSPLTDVADDDAGVVYSGSGAIVTA